MENKRDEGMKMFDTSVLFSVLFTYFMFCDNIKTKNMLCPFLPPPVLLLWVFWGHSVKVKKLTVLVSADDCPNRDT